MGNHKVIGILNFHTSPSLGKLTDNRPLGSTSYLGRYAFCDFALSNFTNSGIQNVGLLIKENPRSILKHLGNMRSYLTNTKICQYFMMFNEKAIAGKEVNTDINNIKANDFFLYDHDVDYLVFQSSHIVCNINLQEMLQEHISRGEDISIMYTKIKDASKEFLGEYVLDIDKDGYVKKATLNPKEKKEAFMSCEVWIINRRILRDIIKMESKETKSMSFRHIMKIIYESEKYKVHTYEYKGYVRCFDSYEHYCEYSKELLDKDIFNQFFIPEWTHYTLTHDTPPALYGENSLVTNSFISNGDIVEGEVKNSIISRRVKIGKGAKISNSMIFTGTVIGEGAVIKNCLIDKHSKIGDNVKLIGEDTKVLKYFKQGTKI